MDISILYRNLSDVRISVRVLLGDDSVWKSSQDGSNDGGPDKTG